MSNAETTKPVDKIKPGTMLTKPPKLEQLEEGQVVMVQLYASQLGPGNPRMPSTYAYARHGRHLFRYLVEVVQ